MLRANPRYKMKELSDIVIPLFKQDKNYTPAHFEFHYKSAKVEFNKSHEEQGHINKDYAFGWISEYMHRIYGYERIYQGDKNE